MQFPPASAELTAVGSIPTRNAMEMILSLLSVVMENKSKNKQSDLVQALRENHACTVIGTAGYTAPEHLKSHEAQG